MYSVEYSLNIIDVSLLFNVKSSEIYYYYTKTVIIYFIYVNIIRLLYYYTHSAQIESVLNLDNLKPILDDNYTFPIDNIPGNYSNRCTRFQISS